MLIRDIFSKISKEIDSPNIILLNGARQTGKTSLLRMIETKLLSDGLAKPEQIHFFDLEKITDLELWNNQSAATSLPFVTGTAVRQFLFIDEFQHSKTIGSTLKVLHDHYPHLKIIITGSASWYTSIDESMAGRKRVFSVWPLSFTEYIEWQNNSTLKQNWQIANHSILTTPKAIIEQINLTLLEYLTYGGYPGVVLQTSRDEKIKLLDELLNSYLTRDIQLLDYAINPTQLKKILSLLAAQVGGLLDVSNIATNASIGRTALMNRFDLLQRTYILNLIRPFFTNKITELVKNPKIFLVDSGFCNMLLQTFSLQTGAPTFGQIAENFAITEIFKQNIPQMQINFWRTKQGQEVDMVLRKENESIPVEIKSGDIETIPNGLRSFIRAYHPHIAYVLNWSNIKDVKFDGCDARFRPLWWANNILL